MPNRQTKTNLFIVNFITGMSDGLVLPFVACIIAHPFFKAHPENTFFVGIAVAIIGGVAFGLARYFGEQEEIEHHHPVLSQDEAQKELDLMRRIGIAADITEDVKVQMDQERELWLKEVEDNDMGWENRDSRRALASGLQTALGFLSGGTLVCLPILALIANDNQYHVPIVIALVLLLVFSILKAKLANKNVGQATAIFFIKGVLILTIATCIAMLVAKIRN